MILNDTQLLALQNEKPFIEPFCEEQIKTCEGKKVISYGLSSFGYDIRVGNIFKIFTTSYFRSGSIDPKNFDLNLSTVFTGDTCILPPHSMALCHSMETFTMPEDVLAIAVGKSTYARCGLLVNVTPLEPSWCGVLTIEISNLTDFPLMVYANEGIAQLIFFRGEKPKTSYASRNGKYQNQTGILEALV